MEPITNNPPLIVIAGQTASGKSALALDIAKRFNGEIICADSWTVRREVTIGTAKPTAQDLRAVPHHLLDIVDPCEDFTAAIFKRLAIQKIKAIHARGKLPIMVGGTGLYIDGVIFDYSFLPTAGTAVREDLNAKTIPQLLSIIAAEGYETENIDIRNKRRLIRLIETQGLRPERKSLRPNTLVLGITLAKDILDERIAKRVDMMFANGLQNEVHCLADTYGWECEALKGIGYQEWKEYFLGRQSLDTTKERIIKNTRALAKRQKTWFKRNSAIVYIREPEEYIDIITTYLNKQYMA